MTFIQHNTTPSARFLDHLLSKVNAGLDAPRVVVELDKMVYVPGVKFKYESMDTIFKSSMNNITTTTVVNSGGETGGGGGDTVTIAELQAMGEPTTFDPKQPEVGKRFEYIKCAFQSQLEDYGLNQIYHAFAMAIAKHETGYGTLGQGRPQNGSFIVGYGCPGSCDMRYKGIMTQAKYTMKRIKDALKSKDAAIRNRGYLTQSDIDYFHDGGDKGKAYTWSADGANWKKSVLNYYNTIRNAQQLGDPAKYKCSKGNVITPLSMIPVNKSAILNGEEDSYYNDGEIELYNEPKITASSSSTSDGKMTFPIAGVNLSQNGVITSKFWSENPSRPTHLGIDLSTNLNPRCAGRDIVSAYDGKIVRVGYDDSYGYHVFIEHYNGYSTCYAHMQRNSVVVKKGQEIKAGQKIGKCGSTGNSTGAHLHFEIYKGAWKGDKHSKLNPRPFLEGTQVANASVGSGGSEVETVTLQAVENKVFDKCFNDNNKVVPKQFTDIGVAKYFSVKDPKTKTVVHAVGFKTGALPKGGYDSMTLTHNFTVDGYFQPKLYLNLGEGDIARIRVDGVTYKEFTKANNGIIETEPIYVAYSNTGSAKDTASTINTHTFDFYVSNTSGKAEAGIACMKLVEVENIYVGYEANYRKRSEWIETGDMVFDKTFYLEHDILSWEVNMHFDTDSATARVTLDNAKRIYSPTYELSNNFPRNVLATDMSYIDYGERRHLISEGTPVRIYAGYGNDLVRVFTGLITGEIEDSADDNTITFSCVDMYSVIENHIFVKPKSYPEVDPMGVTSKVQGDVQDLKGVQWVLSSVIHNIAVEAGMTNWRVVEDDWRYPDIVVEETYYIDIDRGGQVATVWDAKEQKYISKSIQTVKTIEGFKNPYVVSISFEQGTRASDAMQQLIGETMYRTYCDRYGTFRLESTRDVHKKPPKWDFIDNVNMMSLSTSIDYTRTRNHLMILGSSGNTDHFIDKDLLVATKGKLRTAQVSVPWINEADGSNARGTKQELADRLFGDMKRQSRTFNVLVKGNPLIDVTDGCYLYSEDSSINGYYVVKGHKISGSAETMISSLELTWENKDIRSDL